MDLLLSVDTPENQQRFLVSLGAIDGASIDRFRRPWKSLSPAQQVELLTAVSTAEPGKKDAAGAQARHPARPLRQPEGLDQRRLLLQRDRDARAGLDGQRVPRGLPGVPASRRASLRCAHAIRRTPLVALVALLLAASAAGQALPQARSETLAPVKPEAVGLSSERLRRLSGVMKRYVDDGRVAGVVTLVARGGRIAHLEAVGQADREAGVPMKTDTIFRIASMSKAVTSVAAMMLVEEGRLGLGDPVSKYIPSFKKTTVFVAPPAGAVPGTPLSAVPAKREITVRDLLTHTSGISYGSGAPEAQYKAANVFGWYFADKAEPTSAAIDRLAALPFEAQPGEKYVYGFSTDVLGVVVEKASGQSLDEFFRTRIFEPLRHGGHALLPAAREEGPAGRRVFGQGRRGDRARARSRHGPGRLRGRAPAGVLRRRGPALHRP